ncbi:DNA polymerase-3 subunit epsilon [Alkalicoccus daliensis]|uniref:DNA polymerase-3 subunit epsilon n=2 Tax=Alkalicoccus daliensis TaxID=745820 RepID=A0A1H0IF16_9BACI|nr:DNA polymerase-3 subunit epsilon [Alkalicoccus daliensis]
MNFTAIDFETASSEKGSACAIGIVHVENSEIVEEVYSLIRPFSPYFDPNCVRVHGLTWEDVKESPTFEELWNEIAHLFEGNLLLAHNASFDIRVLRSALDVYQLPYPAASYNCTVQVAKKTWPEFYNYKLSTIAHELNVTFEHHHALEDAKVAAEIMLRAEEIHNAFDEETMLRTLKMSNGTLGPGKYATPGVNFKKKIMALSPQMQNK